MKFEDAILFYFKPAPPFAVTPIRDENKSKSVYFFAFFPAFFPLAALFFAALLDEAKNDFVQAARGDGSVDVARNRQPGRRAGP